MSTVIELKDISKLYGNVVGVDHVDLAVKDGEFLTLLGPSGCGKSTLLRMIAGFETPSSGTVSLQGKDVTYVPPQKRDVNMMFQDYALFPHMTVGQNIAYGLRNKGMGKTEARTAALEALELVGLPDKIDVFPSQMSGGQRQRVALARAVVRRPKVLLLDEPLSALDANLREQMQVELKHMHEKIGISFIMVTHDQTEALVMSDRVVVMNQGRIAQDGTPQELYEHPATPYVANFIGTTNFFDGQLVSFEGQEAIVEVGGRQLHARDVHVAPGVSKVQVGVRPEKARILNGSDGDVSNALSGKVVENIYHGSSIRTTVALETGQEMVVDAVLSMGMALSNVPDPGSTVRIGAEPENLYIFEREE